MSTLFQIVQNYVNNKKEAGKGGKGGQVRQFVYVVYVRTLELQVSIHMIAFLCMWSCVYFSFLSRL